MSKITKKIKVAVIFGGRSGEHEVSLVSAASVMQALDRSKYDLLPIGITKEGRWVSGENSLGLLKEIKEELLPAVKVILTCDPAEKKLFKIDDNNQKNVLTSQEKIDVVFPIIHGTYGEDGSLQGLLEMAGIPYVGAGVLGSAIGMDKVVQKKIFLHDKLPVTKFISLTRSDYQNYSIKQILNKLKLPIFVKPANLGSSVGINKAHNENELKEFIKIAFDYDNKIILEQGINKIREIEVSVLGNSQPIASVPGEIVPSNEFYDYDAKYVDGKSKAIIPAKLSPKLVSKIQKIAVQAYQSAECSGMARVDFFLKGQKVYLSEINTIPGFTSISMYPKLWEATGLSYSELLDRLIYLALEKDQQKKQLKTSYEPKNNWYQQS